MQTLTQLFQQNQFLTGGALLGLVGLAAAYGRRLLWFLVDRGKLLLFCRCQLESAYDGMAVSWLTYWLKSQPRIRRGKHVILRAWGQEEEAELTPATGWHRLRWRGRWLLLHRQLSTAGENRFFTNDSWTLWLRGSRQDLDAFIAECRAAYCTAAAQSVCVRVSVRSYWEEVRKPRRSLETVILPTGRREQLLQEIDQFWASRDWYARHGRPWRRGYLFSGPPGSGKTSLALALAAHYRKTVYLLNFSSITDGAAAVSLLLSVPNDVILLIEDMDRDLPTLAATTNDTTQLPATLGASNTFGNDIFTRHAIATGQQAPSPAAAPGPVVGCNTAAGGVSVSTLLNALDGPFSSEGRLLIITTNHPERIDPVLLRPGRVDRRLGFDSTPDQYAQMYQLFFPDASVEVAERFAAALAPYRPSLADLQTLLTTHGHCVWSHLDELAAEKSLAVN